MRKTLFVATLFAATLSCPAAWAQTPPQSPPPAGATLTVTGSGKAQAKPDLARLTVEATSKAQTLDGAVKASKTLGAQVDALLQSLKPETLEVESSNFTLTEQHPPYPPPAPQAEPPEGRFAATTTYSLKVDSLDHLDPVIEKLASSGLVEMRGVTFHVRDENAPLDQARRAAVADARRQAATIADAAGVRLDEIAAISDAQAAPRPFLATVARFAPVTPPSDLDFGASIVMTWHISPKP